VAQQLTVKAEVTIQMLADGGGYIVNGVAVSDKKVGPEGQAIPIDKLMRARESVIDAIEDVKTFLARNSTLAISS